MPAPDGAVDDTGRATAFAPVRANGIAAHPASGPTTLAADTPLRWRFGALAWLALPVLVGRVLADRLSIPVTAALSAIVPIALARPLVKATATPPIEPVPHLDGSPQSITVIVTAHNEAAVIGNLIADLGRQDYLRIGPDGLEIIVIDDRSTDDTSGVVTRAAAAAGISRHVRVVRRSGDGPRLKSAALASVPPETCRGDVIVHFDADARIDHQFLTNVARYAAAGAEALTARRAMLPRPGLLASLQADEIVADGALLEGRWAVGGTSDFRGNGATVRRDLMSAVGGWPAALTEDIDLSTRIATSHGIPVIWGHEAVVWEEPVLSWRGLWRQRVRWGEGVLRRTFRYGPEVMRTARLGRRARLEFVLYAGQLALPGAVFGAGLTLRRRRLPTVAIGMLAGYALFQWLLAWHGLRDEPIGLGGDPAAGLLRHPPSIARRCFRSLRAALFHVVWLGTVPHAAWLIATRRGPVTFAKTTHLDSTFLKTDGSAAPKG
jgi:glycosyltransferase involved in cell wall biosynthesis